MNRTRNDKWKIYNRLTAELKRLIMDGLQQSELLPYTRRDFSQYAWNQRTLKRRIKFFNLKNADTHCTFNEAVEAIANELEDP